MILCLRNQNVSGPSISVMCMYICNFKVNFASMCEFNTRRCCCFTISRSVSNSRSKWLVDTVDHSLHSMEMVRV